MFIYIFWVKPHFKGTCVAIVVVLDGLFLVSTVVWFQTLFIWAARALARQRILNYRQCNIYKTLVSAHVVKYVKPNAIQIICMILWRSTANLCLKGKHLILLLDNFLWFFLENMSLIINLFVYIHAHWYLITACQSLIRLSLTVQIGST